MPEDKLIPALAAGETSKPRSLAGAIGAFFAYQALSILFYGRGMIFRLAEVHAGNRRDPQIFIWCFQWWPHAIAHRLDAFHPRIIWAPEGVDLAWVTSGPLPSLIAAPLTARYGAVVSYNLASLLMPALAALTAFLLVRRIAGSTWPAMLGGYLFGFSPFMIGHQAAGHLVLTAAFLVPVVVYLALLRLDEEISRAGFVAALAATLVCQFLIGQEIFATIIMFGAIALLVAYCTIPASADRIRSLAILCALALGASAVVLTPLLYRVVVASGLSSRPVWNTTPQATDLVELLIPTSTLMMGGFAPLAAIGGHYSHGSIDTGAYTGVPLLVIVFWFFRSRWKRPETRFLAIMLATIYVASFGARLHIAGHELFGMPWKLLSRMPLINSAFPTRLTLYLYLIVALIASLWIAELRASAAAKTAIVAAVALFMLPTLNAGRFVYELDTPDFFRSGAYRNYLAQGETILALPFGEMGSSMYWQAETGMYFAIAEGHFGPTPQSFLAWPIVGAFLDGGEIPDAPAQLNAFMATHGVTAVVFRQRDPAAAAWRAMLESSGARIQAIDDVVLAWGFISPVRFIPIAEQCGLIAELGVRVLKDACAFAASLPDGRIAVNLSPAQFLSNNLADVIGDVLAENNLSTRRLELEITEGVLIADERQALSTLNSLHDRGLHLALDDFGTGYASLSYLRRFPFDRIKIDQSFVRAQEHDAATRAITESILTMARRLRLEVTAEGVETDRHLNLLLSQGCPEVQGFLLGRPMPAARARAFYAGHGGAERVWRLTAA